MRHNREFNCRNRENTLKQQGFEFNVQGTFLVGESKQMFLPAPVNRKTGFDQSPKSKFGRL